MLKKAVVEEQTEHIRRQVRELPDKQRGDYYRLTEAELKDPDTYATLNYIFIAGLHHFYLKKWSVGLINIGVFWGGVACILLEQIELGIALLIGITLFELYELFQSQTIVQDYNNTVSERVIQQLLNAPS